MRAVGAPRQTGGRPTEAAVTARRDRRYEGMLRRWRGGVASHLAEAEARASPSNAVGNVFARMCAAYYMVYQWLNSGGDNAR
jgi:hypothetical protein